MSAIITKIRRFVKAILQPNPGVVVYVPESDSEDWQPVELDNKGPLYWASFEVEPKP